MSYLLEQQYRPEDFTGRYTLTHHRADGSVARLFTVRTFSLDAKFVEVPDGGKIGLVKIQCANDGGLLEYLQIVREGGSWNLSPGTSASFLATGLRLDQVPPQPYRDNDKFGWPRETTESGKPCVNLTFGARTDAFLNGWVK